MDAQQHIEHLTRVNGLLMQMLYEHGNTEEEIIAELNERLDLPDYGITPTIRSAAPVDRNDPKSTPG